MPGYEAPINLVYSQRNRSAGHPDPRCTRRSERAKRIEFRTPDPTCNPYLSFAACVMAGLDGIANKIDPGQPIDKDLYELPPEEQKKIKQLPGALDVVLDNLEKDHDFLLKGDVFTPGPHRDLDRVQAEERGRRDPAAAASVRVRALLRHLVRRFADQGTPGRAPRRAARRAILPPWRVPSVPRFPTGSCPA